MENVTEILFWSKIVLKVWKWNVLKCCKELKWTQNLRYESVIYQKKIDTLLFRNETNNSPFWHNLQTLCLDKNCWMIPIHTNSFFLSINGIGSPSDPIKLSLLNRRSGLLKFDSTVTNRKPSKSYNNCNRWIKFEGPEFCGQEDPHPELRRGSSSVRND